MPRSLNPEKYPLALHAYLRQVAAGSAQDLTCPTVKAAHQLRGQLYSLIRAFQSISDTLAAALEPLELILIERNSQDPNTSAILRFRFRDSSPAALICRQALGEESETLEEQALDLLLGAGGAKFGPKIIVEPQVSPPQPTPEITNESGPLFAPAPKE